MSSLCVSSAFYLLTPSLACFVYCFKLRRAGYCWREAVDCLGKEREGEGLKHGKEAQKHFSMLMTHQSKVEGSVQTENMSCND